VRRKRMDGEALEALMVGDWQANNVRELRNVIERMILASEGETLGLAQVPAELRSGGTAPRSAPAGRTFHELKAEAERQIIVAALERNDWHITRTAQELGLADHASLLKIMRRHELKRE